MKKALVILLLVVFTLGLFPLYASASTVYAVDISDIDLPVAGDKPDLTARLNSLSGVMNITLVEWSEYDPDWEWQRDLAANDTFKEGYWYVVYVHLQTSTGHSFGQSVAGTVNGTNAKKVGNATQANGTKVAFYVSYQATKRLTSIDKVELSVVKPFVGKTPTFAKVETDKYVSEKYGTVSNCTNGVTWTNQSSGVNITVSNPFKEGNKYTVSYYLTAKDGYKFDRNTVGTINGVAAKITLTDHWHAIVSLSDLVPGDKTAISSVNLTVVKPFVGKTPTFAKVETAEYVSEKYGTVASCTNGVTWTNQSSGINITVSNPFKEGAKYKVSYYLTAKDGYKFTANTNCTINGTKAVLTLTDATHAIVSLSDLVPGDKTAISSVNLTVVRPIIGKTPTFAKVETAEYVSEKYGTVSNCTNGVTWTRQSNGINLTVNNPFKEEGVYKVSYYLTAKDGYKFTAGTSCTINGMRAALTLTDATHAIVSLSDLVPGDGKKELVYLELNVPAPKEGEKPGYTKLDGVGYYSDNGLNGSSTRIYKNGIAWYKSASSYITPGTTETFKGGSEYTLKISVLPKEGYKFSKTLTASINGKTASVESFDDGSVTVSIKLTALSKEHTHTASGWKNDNDAHWKVCTDASCGELTTAKEAHKDQNKDNKCDVCGYAIPKPSTTVTTATEPSVPSKSTASTTTASNGTNTTSSQNTSAVTEPSASEPEQPLPTESGTESTTKATEPTTKATESTTKATVDADVDNDDGETPSFPVVWIVIAVIVILGAAAAGVILLKKKKR